MKDIQDRVIKTIIISENIKVNFKEHEKEWNLFKTTSRGFTSKKEEENKVQETCKTTIPELEKF